MINIDIINRKIKLESKVIELKLALAQKEDKNYSQFIQDPLNASMVKSAKDKIVSQLKQEDSEWLEMESDLSLAETSLKALNIKIDILRDTLKSLSNPSSGVNFEMFDRFQTLFIKDL